MKKFGMALALIVAAGAAQAKETNTSLFGGHNTGLGNNTETRSTQVLNVNVSGTPSWDSYGSPNNVVMTPNIGAGSHVTGIGYDVTLHTNGASWLSELECAFEDSGQTTGVFLSPGYTDSFSGSGTYSSGGIIDLVGLGLDFTVGADGVLRMEFFEGFDDVSNSIDGVWDQGILQVQYDTIPAPGAMALFAGAGIMASRRRR